MSAGNLEVVAVAGLATVQDDGRPGHMHEGVPPGGALVPELLAWANEALGNAAGAAALEVIGGIGLVARGAEVRVSIDGAPARSLADGERLDVAAHPRHRARYVAVAGGVDVPRVLGSRSTLLVAAIGGHEGRALRRGDRLALGHDGDARLPATARATDLDLDAPIAVIPGPDLARLGEASLAALLGGVFTLSPASDRTGARLDGPSLVLRVEGNSAVRAVSTPMVAGSIEVPASGAPIVLGPDHPTTGGYPVVATVVRGDLGRFAARKIGAAVRFREAAPALPGLSSPRK